MNHLTRCAWATVAMIAVVGGATAQTTATTTTGTTGTTTTTTGNTGQGGPSATINGSTGNSGIQIQQEQPPTITSTSSGAVQQSNVVATSNAFAPYLANPMYQGRSGVQSTSLTTVIGPGGFGQSLYGATGGASGASGAGGTGGAASRTTGRTGTTGATGSTALGGATSTASRTGGGLGSSSGGLGGTTGRAGGAFGSNSSNSQNQNQQMSSGRQIAYTQTPRFPAIAPVPPAQLQADLQTMLNTSFNTGGVQATLGDGGVVVLRGRVADDDEARSVAGMVLLTPGVKEVKNELTTR